MIDALSSIAPIAVLLLVIGAMLMRLPKVELGHSPAFMRRRTLNWLPLGLLYAFLYMGRYNLTVSKSAFKDRMDNAAFAEIFAVGTIVYGASFLLNGPVTDRIGGRNALLIGAAGTIAANVALGFVAKGYTGDLVPVFSVLYAMNMYFQSFGAVAVVKANAPWFHVRERGVFGAIFGILISLGLYFAYDWGYFIIKHFPLEWVFFVPAILLTVLFAVVFVVAKDSPGEAGFTDFDTGDATDDGPPLGVAAVFLQMLRNPAIMTIACIEFCSGFLRQALMQWYKTFVEQTGLPKGMVYEHWGLWLCVAGILGGTFAGVISDHLFSSRRGPVSAVLYGVMVLGAVALTGALTSPALGWIVLVMSMSIIGVHGMLSGTASMDFGGRRNTGVAVGIIDGMVYAGTGLMSVTYGRLLPNGDAAKDVANWWAWPVAMIPVAILGLALSTRLWNATPRGAPAAHG
jgi:OPA family glycerol-3-phosphate transporter-like MFS transporter